MGDIGTGKTSIIKRYVHGIFSNHYKVSRLMLPDVDLQRQPVTHRVFCS